MPHYRPLGFPSFPQNAYFFREHFHYSGPVPHLYHMLSRYSGPASHSPHTYSRDSGPTPKRHSGPVRMLAGPIRMPLWFHDRPDIPTPVFFKFCFPSHKGTSVSSVFMMSVVLLLSAIVVLKT